MEDSRSESALWSEQTAAAAQCLHGAANCRGAAQLRMQLVEASTGLTTHFGQPACHAQLLSSSAGKASCKAGSAAHQSIEACLLCRRSDFWIRRHRLLLVLLLRLLLLLLLFCSHRSPQVLPALQLPSI